MKVLRPWVVGLAILVGMGLFTSSVEAKDDGFALALSQDVPGKNNVGGRGGEFAPELYNRFVKAGGEAYLVSFKWRREFEKPEQMRSSTVVIFRDANGRYWGMDMYSNQPTWVPGQEPQKWLDRLYPSLITQLVSSKTEPSLAGRYADRSRVASGGANTTAPASTPAPVAQPSANVSTPATSTMAAQ